MGNENSLLYWFPKVRYLGIPVPRTAIVEVEASALWAMLDGKDELTAKTKQALVEAGETIGYPLFLRTDQLSNKHQWKDSCYVPEEKALFQHIYGVMEGHGMAFGVPDPRALVFRELLPTSPAFHAFNGLPIVKERRYFVRDGWIKCAHPYWPEGAIENPSRPDWKQLLAEQSNQSLEEEAQLALYASQVTIAVPGYWSVDFLEASDGQWYLIDMALGDRSFHPAHEEGCQKATPLRLRFLY